MAYATAEDVQRRMVKTLTDEQIDVCAALLDDAGVLIDALASNASDEAKASVSCSMVIRAMGSQGDMAVPMGATQGSASALGYSQSWTFGNGATGELYLSRTEKRILGVGNKIGSYSPVEELAT
jgi:hypothetical protein